MNKVSLIGRLTRDPDLRYSESGKAICNFTLALRNPFNREGQADFVNCVAWEKGAELVAELHEKGNMIGVDGRIASRNYENNEGQTVYVTEVTVSEIHLIQTKDNQQNDNNNNRNNSNSNSNTNSNKSKSNSSSNKNTNGSGNRNSNSSNNRNSRQRP